MLSDTAKILSLSYMPRVSPLAPTSCEDLEEVEAPALIDTQISFETSTPGMTLRLDLPNGKPPPGIQFFPRPRQKVGGSGGAGGEAPPPVEDNTPFWFLRKYWYIIAPFMLFNLFGAEAEKPKGQQQQLGQGSAAPAGTPQAATSPTGRGGSGTPQQAATSPRGGGGGASSEGTTRRRGKRG